MKLRFFICLGLIFCFVRIFAIEIWVSPNGNDDNCGTKDNPKATLLAALRQAREWRRLNNQSVNEGVTICLDSGVHFLYESLFLRPEDSGTEDYPLIIKGVGNNESVISGGVQLKHWKKQGKLFVTDVPIFNGCALNFRQLWINGIKAVRARDVDDFEKMHKIRSVDAANRVLWVPSESVKNILKSPYPEMVLHEMWCVANLRINSIKIHGDSAAVRFHNPESRIQFEHPWPRPMVTQNGHNSPFYLTNAKELLDTPGEWFHDIKSGKLYYMPREGENVSELCAIIPAVETLVRLVGTLDRKVVNVVFDNITFSHTTWMRPSRYGHVPLQAGMYLIDAYQIAPMMERGDGNHRLDNQGWVGRPAAAVSVYAGNNIDFINCSFIHLGSTGIDYEYGTLGGKISGCVFADVAGNGILAGSFSPEALETHLPYDPFDKREVCKGLHITNNYITNVANEDWGALGICAGYVSDFKIAHNEISEIPYTGISLGWGWNQTVGCMRNNIVHANLIHHYAKHMYDVAGIYTLGAQPKTIISDNCVHSIYSPSYVHDPNHWFYLYTDEGSSFITVRDNWTESEKYLKNANGPCNTWQNNGPNVQTEIRNKAGLEKEYQHLKTRNY